jgi:hypothetical protein
MNATQALVIRTVTRLLATATPTDRATGDAIVILMAAGMRAADVVEWPAAA